MLLEAMSDIVACEPVARYLRREMPDACIVWGVKAAYRELIDTNPHVDMTLIVHCLSERLLLERAELFDRFVDLHVPGRYCALCRRPLMRSAESAVRLDNYFEHGTLLAAFARSAGLPPLDEAPRVYIPAAAVARVDALHLPSRFVAVNCASSSAEKNWLVEKWQALSKAMPEVPFVEVGLRPQLPDVLNLCGRLSILETAEVIRRAALFIGVDSGPAHLANAVGVPGVVLIGRHLGFERYQPFSGAYGNGERAELIYSDGTAAAIPVETVLQAAHRLLS